MSEKKAKKNSTTKPGRKGGIMIHPDQELRGLLKSHAAEMRARIPGVGEDVIGVKEAVFNILHLWKDAKRSEGSAIAAHVEDPNR